MHTHNKHSAKHQIATVFVSSTAETTSTVETFEFYKSLILSFI